MARLKPILNGLILLNKVFVGGKHIQDNLVASQEAFHYLKKNVGASQGFAIKLDMNKAYDHVDWFFLKNVLFSYVFCPSWVSLFMSLVSSATKNSAFTHGWNRG